MNNNEIDTIARRILSDYDAVTTETIFTEGLRLDLTDARRVQTAVTGLREKRGERVIGYKVGAVDPGNQRLLGMPHPAWGRLWDSELHQNGVELCSEPVTELSAPRNTDLKLIYDNVIVDEWDSLRWPDDILAPLKWLTTALSEHGITLKSGALVLTSAWGPPFPVNDNNKAECSSSAFGSVSATFD